MIKNTIKAGLALYSIYQMITFAKPKLLAYDISVKTFTQFGDVLPINGKLFMYFTGVVEALIVILLVLSLVGMFTGKQRFQNVTGIAGNGLLFCTMIVALVCEFFVRVNPVQHLVVLGSVLLAVSVFQLLLIESHRIFTETSYFFSRQR